MNNIIKKYQFCKICVSSSPFPKYMHNKIFNKKIHFLGTGYILFIKLKMCSNEGRKEINTVQF
jgi:hypothetical protein